MRKEIIKQLRGEFIGKKAVILDRQHKKKMQGIIVDETKHMFTIETSKGYKKIQKQSSFIRLKTMEIDGRIIEIAPEERIRMKVKA
jgi:RNase P/RNase MRP subunit p29